MTIEAKYGVPTVAMHTDKFDRVVRSVAAVNGMAELRQVFVPQPVMGKSARELRAYVDGKDPLTGRPVMQEVIEGLTTPLDGQGVGTIEYDRSTPRLEEADTEENLHRLFMENRWTDYLPIVLPTEERVAAMLAATRRKPDEVVGRMRPTHFREAWEYTVEKVAVNAVMAGARPGYFPVVLALAATGVSARGRTTRSMAAIAPVHRLHARHSREALARARRQHAARHGSAHSAPVRARSHHRAPVHRPRRLHQEGRADRLDLRDGADARERVLGLPACAELSLPAGDVRRGAVGHEAQGLARRDDPDVPARGHPRRGRGRRDQRLLANHGRVVREDRLGRRLAVGERRIVVETRQSRPSIGPRPAVRRKLVGFVEDAEDDIARVVCDDDPHPSPIVFAGVSPPA